MLASVEQSHGSAANTLGPSKYALALVCFSLGSDEVPRVSSGMKMFAKALLAVPRRTVGKHLI